MSEKKNAMPFEMNLPVEVADGIYSNLAIISHSPFEFVVDFVRIMPGVKEPSVKSRVILTPETAKKLLFALRDNISKYEAQYEEIKLHNNPMQGSEMPMSFGGGEA